MNLYVCLVQVFVGEGIKPGTERNRKYLLYNADMDAGHMARILR